MFLQQWTTQDLLLMGIATVALVGILFRFIPSARPVFQKGYSYAEITAYDRRIPLYFVAAALALFIGGLHIIVKNVPGFWQWLWEAGYGGHLFRDLSNSHIIIVGGGTVLLTGLTWYALPRFTRCPLYSKPLASISLWCTLIGVFGFYLAWLILGLVEGNMVRNGWDYQAAKDALGSWHTLPTRITSSIMGIGYWTYVLNALLTAWAGRAQSDRSYGHLIKFCVVSAVALFVGTVQGVLQVLPDNADWIHAAGKFGQYVDPISHAHINLVTGMMVSLAAFFVYFSPRLGGKPITRAVTNRIFWALTVGSLAFYGVFLVAGLTLGGAVNGYGGIQSSTLTSIISRSLTPLLAGSGLLMLIGFWIYFFTIWRSLGLRSIGQRFREGQPAAFWLISSLTLAIGTFQGLLQVLPQIGALITIPEEIPNIHAQLNMIGGIMLALIGTVYLLLPELVGKEVDQRLKRITLMGVSYGIFGYYIVTLLLGLSRLGYLRQGMTSVESAAQLGWAAPALLMLSALPLLAGFAAFGLSVLRMTGTFRADFVRELHETPARFTGPLPERIQRTRPAQIIAIEFLGGLFGWPGMGWFYAGQAFIAVPLMMIGPSIAWALLPMLFSPYNDTMLAQYNWLTLMVWLPASALISSGLLALYLRRRQSMRTLTPASEEAIPRRDMPKSLRLQLPHWRKLSFVLVLVLLFSIPVLPWAMGIVDSSPTYTLLPELSPRSSGAYLRVEDGEQAGYIKLYTWTFPLQSFPDSAPTLNPAQIQDLTIVQRGLDLPGRYRLYHLDNEGDADIVTLEPETEARGQLGLRPIQALPAGEYLLDIPVDGMFAGREYYYFRLDPSVNMLPIAPSVVSTTSVPVPSSRWLDVLPISSMLLSVAITAVMLRRLKQKIRPHEAAWAVAFAMFALAATSQVVADRFGWTPMLARLYYLNGATLTVGWLGLGSWLVVIQRPRLRNLALWGLLLLTGMSIGIILDAPVDMTRLMTEGWRALEKPPALTAVTLLLNTAGTFVLVGGALWSAWVFWRRRILRARMVGLVLLAAGALTVAAGGSLTRLGQPEYLYLAMTLGIALMFWGYLKTIQTSSPSLRTEPLQTSPAVPTASAAGN